MRAHVLGALVFWLASACTTPQNSRCKELCQRQIECTELEEQKKALIDEHECTSACSALDRDSEGKKLVDSYAACIEAAGKDCRAVLACK